ncbi:MAG: AI-2E family transporter [Calditrichia bacterium]
MNKPVKILFALIVLAIVLFFLKAIAPLVKIIIVSSLLSYILDPVTSALESRGFSRTLSTLIVFFYIIILLVGFVLLILPVISREIHAIQAGIAAGKARQLFQQLEELAQSRLGFLGMKEINLSEKAQGFLSNFGKDIFNYLLNVVSLITNLVIIPFIMFFLLKDGPDIKKAVISLVPNRYFEFSLNLLHKMDLQLGNYLRGQFLDALIIGILSIIALWILGVNYFFVIGAFAGLANLIPYIGPIAGAIPAIIVSIMQTGSFELVPWIALAFILVQLIDNVIVQPLVVAKTVNLHPLIVLLVVIIGGQFFGILGMILAVPFTGVVKVVAQEAYWSYKQYHF